MTQQLKSNLERLDVLYEIYNDLSSNYYPTKKELQVAKLKMQLIKKEILLLTYIINKDIVGL